MPATHVPNMGILLCNSRYSGVLAASMRMHLYCTPCSITSLLLEGEGKHYSCLEYIILYF